MAVWDLVFRLSDTSSRPTAARWAPAATVPGEAPDSASDCRSPQTPVVAAPPAPIGQLPQMTVSMNHASRDARAIVTLQSADRDAGRRSPQQVQLVERKLIRASSIDVPRDRDMSLAESDHHCVLCRSESAVQRRFARPELRSDYGAVIRRVPGVGSPRWSVQCPTPTRRLGISTNLADN